MTIEELNDILESVANIVADFLIEEGGMQNGFETSVEGFIGKESAQLELVLSFEQRKTLTVQRVRMLGMELAELVRSVLSADFWAAFKTVNLTHAHVEGCYDTYVSATTTKNKIELYEAAEKQRETQPNTDDGTNGFEPVEVVVGG